MDAERMLAVRIPVDLYERLRTAAYEERVPQKAIVVRALERELADAGKS